MTDLLAIQNEIHQNSVDHGFWEASDDIPTKLMLIVTEISEAMEAYRDDDMVVRTVISPQAAVSVTDVDEALDRKPEGFPVELADVVIRILDLAGWLGIDLGAVIDLKVAYNKTRPHLHGRKV